MKRVFLLSVLVFFVAGAFAQNQSTGFDLTQYGVRIEPDRRLMVVAAALEAAGWETPLTPKGAEFRRRLKTDFEELNPKLRQDMKFFVDQYAKRFAEKYKAELKDKEGRPLVEEQKAFAEGFEKYRSGALGGEDKKEEKRLFLEKHRSFFNGLTSAFISMAYTLSPVPDLSEPARTTDLPGDLLEVLDFSPLLRQFYRSPIKVAVENSENSKETRALTVGARLDEYHKEYLAAGDSLRPSTARMVRDLLDYLHTKPEITYIEQIKTEVQKSKSKKETISRTESRERTRRFFIVPDLLAQAGTINFRNIGDDYYAIVPPETDLSESEVRRAYLQFVLDPVILKNAKEIATLRAGIKALLDERRKANPDISPDVFLAVSRSLVAAADAKQIAFQKFQEATAAARRNAGTGGKPISETTDAQGRKVVRLTEELYLIDGRFAMPAVDDEVALKLSEAYEDGAVLSFYFADQLKGLEDSQFDIAGSLRDMILSLDPAKEANRYNDHAEARRRALAYREEQRKAAVAVVESPLIKKLTEIEPMIKLQKFAAAETELKQLLQTNPDEPRIYYALGRVKSLAAAVVTDVEVRNRELKEASDFYIKVLDPKGPKADSALVSLTYVALGRIAEYYDQNERAIQIYEAAIKIGDVKGGAYQEAVSSRERLIKER